MRRTGCRIWDIPCKGNKRKARAEAKGKPSVEIEINKESIVGRNIPSWRVGTDGYQPNIEPGQGNQFDESMKTRMPLQAHTALSTPQSA